MAWARYPTWDILAALRASRSVNQAAKLLGMSQGALRKRCLREPLLLADFRAATMRGKAYRWPGKTKVRRSMQPDEDY